MRSTSRVVRALAAAALLATSAAAWADGRHFHGHYSHGPRVSLGFAFGAPFWYPAPVYPYPYPYAYAYPPVVVQPAPRVYIERPDQVARDETPGYWYYCRESNTYYPYAKECAGPWERVPAQPQSR